MLAEHWAKSSFTLNRKFRTFLVSKLVVWRVQIAVSIIHKIGCAEYITNYAKLSKNLEISGEISILFWFCSEAYIEDCAMVLVVGDRHARRCGLGMLCTGHLSSAGFELERKRVLQRGVM